MADPLEKGGVDMGGLLFPLTTIGNRQQHSVAAMLGHFLKVQDEVVICQMKALVASRYMA